MPIYLVECINCGLRKEVLVSCSLKDKIECDTCGTIMQVIPSAADFIINGSKSHKGTERKNYE